MKLKKGSKEKINIYKNKVIKTNNNISKNITYNKPLFISMKNDNSIHNNSFQLIQKNSTISTKICTTNGESPYNKSFGNKILNNNYNRINSVKDFEIDNNYSKTTLNFFSKYVNTSISSNEDYNNNYETFTPSRQKKMEFIEEDKEQFTPYLGEKKPNDENSKENKKESLNKKNKYSIIFNNSKKEIDSISLNLRNHFDEELSNKCKIINKFQKLAFYQKKNGLNSRSKSRNKKKDGNTNYSYFLKLNKNSKAINKQILYKKKSENGFIFIILIYLKEKYMKNMLF